MGLGSLVLLMLMTTRKIQSNNNLKTTLNYYTIKRYCVGEMGGKKTMRFCVSFVRGISINTTKCEKNYSSLEYFSIFCCHSLRILASAAAFAFAKDIVNGG